MSRGFTRRRFIVTAGAAASTFLGSSIFNLDSVWAAPVTRRNLGGMAGSDPVLVSYANAIKAMRALPTSNPLSWNYQAAIHGTTLSGSNIAWNTCEHGTHFFWSWHRMYLYWFERIIRKMANDPGWALPYWDYNSPSQRSLPVPFRDSSSALYWANRGLGWNAGTTSFAGYRVDPSNGNSFLDFFDAQSHLEQTPHNNVHVDISGDMGVPDTAAIDPVFYVHHSNIDRLWNLWLAQGGGRHDPLDDSDWKNNSYTFFNESGAAVHMTACDILRCAEQLNYTYEGEPPEVKERCLRLIPFPIYYLIWQVLIHWPGPPVELNERPVSVPIDIREVRQRLMPLLESKKETLALELDNVVADRSPGASWDVYLGLPPKAEPNPESPYFVGTVSLFSAGVRSHHHGKFTPERFTFPANRAILAGLRENQEQLQVTFVPAGPLINGKPSRPKVLAPVHIGAISISVGRPQERKEGGATQRPSIEPEPKKPQ